MKEFTPHGYSSYTNCGGLEIEISDDGSEARLRDSNSGEVSDWLEICYKEISDEDSLAYVNCPWSSGEYPVFYLLNEFMRIV